MSFLLRLCLGLLVLAPSLAHSAVLGIPGNGTKLSGIGVISGWKCEAEGDLTVRFNDGDPIPLLYGSERPDVLDAGACDSADVGFVAIWNWGELGDGTHTAVVYDNGVEFDRNTFEVTTLGEPFVEGASTRVSVGGFPFPGETARFVWNEGTQHLELDHFSRNDPPLSQGPYDLLGTWRFTTILMGEDHTDEWTFSSTGTTLDVVPLAVGHAESRYPAQGGWIQDIAPGLNCNYDYAVYWASSLSCNIQAFNLTSPTGAEGVRAFAQPDVLRYFYDSLEDSHIDSPGEWKALKDSSGRSSIKGSTTRDKVAESVWHFTLSYKDSAGVSHARYYDAIAATDYSGIPETAYKKWTIDIGEVRFEWDIVAAEKRICMGRDDTENLCLAINVRPRGANIRSGAVVRNKNGLPFPQPDLNQGIGEAMSVVQVIEPYSCGPYVIYRPEENDVMTTVKRTRPPRLVSEAEQQDGAALLRAVEAVCRPE